MKLVLLRFVFGLVPILCVVLVVPSLTTPQRPEGGWITLDIQPLRDFDRVSAIHVSRDVSVKTGYAELTMLIDVETEDSGPVLSAAMRLEREDASSWRCSPLMASSSSNGARATSSGFPLPLAFLRQLGADSDKRRRLDNIVNLDWTWNHASRRLDVSSIEISDVDGLVELAQSGGQFGPDYGRAAMSGIACNLRLPVSVSATSSTGLAFPQVDVVQAAEQDVEIRHSLRVRYPQSWNLERIGPEVRQDDYQISPGSVDYEFVGQSSQRSMVANEVPVVLANPALERMNAVGFQFALLLLGAWLGVLGGAAGPYLLRRQTNLKVTSRD